MNTGFGDNIRVEAVAKIDGVDVIAVGYQSAKARRYRADPSHLKRRIKQQGRPSSRPKKTFGEYVPFQIAIHDGEEDL
jgi:hypothetical protein